jgi:hypothetical protein
MTPSENSRVTEPIGEPTAADTPVSAPAESYVIPRALAQATLEYLASQPYREVFALVQAFELLEPFQDPAGRPPPAK